MRRQKPRSFKSSPGAKRDRQRHRRGPADSDRVLLYGLHAVEAALANPDRPVIRLLATKNAGQRLAPVLAERGVTLTPATPRDLDRLLGPDTVHQGVALETEPLPSLTIDDLSRDACVIVLDQVTDPQNVGAVLRSAAAFGASALIMTERHSPPLSGAVAKAASGGLDTVPVILVKNLAQALTELGERGFVRIGLGEDGGNALESVVLAPPLALVLGAEGKGLRQLTREHCDHVCRITTQGQFASLNVSNAAAIALHWAGLKLGAR